MSVNKDIAAALREIATLMELKRENPFKIRALQNAALKIESLTQDLEELARQDKLTEVPGIGEGIADRIKEFINLGKMSELEKLRAKFPAGLLKIMEVPGLGPKRARILFEKLKIDSPAKLEDACRAGKVRAMEGFGGKTEENILKGIDLIKKHAGRMLLDQALSLSEEIAAALKKSAPGISRFEPAGSLRRRKETVGDLDFLCAAPAGASGAEKVMRAFTRLPQVDRILAEGPTKSSVILHSGVQCDLRVVPAESFGAALQYFTGSKEHNVALRELALAKGYSINEYGVFRAKDVRGAAKDGAKGGVQERAKPVAGRAEEDIYKTVGLAFIPPELRENRGEIDAAASGKLPKLVTQKDIKGDLHVHSRYSDGRNSIGEMAEAAMARGLEWVVIADHSPSLRVANGLDPARLRKKMDEIRSLNKKLKNFRVLCGTEADILADGRIDYPDEILKELDFVIASVHSSFKMPQKEMTARIRRALANPHVDSLGHPTGRLIGKREAYELDIEEIIRAAADARKALEINAYPERLDMYDYNCQHAKRLGVKMAIGTDSHAAEQLGFMELGVAVARRGWLESGDLLNCLSAEQLLKFRQR